MCIALKNRQRANKMHEQDRKEKSNKLPVQIDPRDPLRNSSPIVSPQFNSLPFLVERSISTEPSTPLPSTPFSKAVCHSHFSSTHRLCASACERSNSRHHNPHHRSLLFQPFQTPTPPPPLLPKTSTNTLPSTEENHVLHQAPINATNNALEAKTHLTQ